MAFQFSTSGRFNLFKSVVWRLQRHLGLVSDTFLGELGRGSKSEKKTMREKKAFERGSLPKELEAQAIPFQNALFSRASKKMKKERRKKVFGEA